MNTLGYNGLKKVRKRPPDGNFGPGCHAQTDAKREVVLEIRDNGVGLIFRKISNDHAYLGKAGLTSMQERAELTGGNHIIKSLPDSGTTVRIAPPIRCLINPLQEHFQKGMQATLFLGENKVICAYKPHS